MKKTWCTLLILLPLFISAQQKKYPPTPDKLYGQLFIDVQVQPVFPDQKTFVDCIAKRKVSDIMYDYGMMKGPKLNIKKFVEDNFDTPPPPPQLNYIQPEKNVAMHMKNLWGVLSREADVSPRWEGKSGNGMSLLALPYPYVVPGGRYREMHYWHSYFIMAGLRASGETAMLENMVKNFDYLIYNFGHVPAGNRTYYLSRSQPPFFCMMVEMLAGIKGNSVYKKYLPSMIKEYAYWMEGAADIKPGEAVKHVVKMKDGEILNRYWDGNNTPRPENYKEDIETADAAANELAMVVKMASEEKLKELLQKKREETFRDIRAGAESGWDLSSRWCANPDKISAIQTTKIIPVDLNCLLYNMESVIAKALRFTKQTRLSQQYTQKAAARKKAVIKYCWNPGKAFFVDYNIETNSQSEYITAAGLYPLFVKMASARQAAAVASTVRSSLLREGGIVTTTSTTGLQWDAPNGWAPLQWIAVNGFRNYDDTALAGSIARRWMGTVEKAYANTGSVMEKYTVEGANNEAGSGEYPAQDGFGWTSAVYLALKRMYP